MNEAEQSPSPVQHTFIAIWSILQSRFKPGSPNYVRATNLEYYYGGYLNYGCHYDKIHSVDVQKFDFTRGSKEEYPEFECSLAKEGYRSDEDCHRAGLSSCTCRGDTCVRHKLEKQITGSSKETAYMNKERWDGHGCDWKVWGSVCGCHNKDRDERQVVWSLATTSKDVGKHKASGKGTYHRAKESNYRSSGRNGNTLHG